MNDKQGLGNGASAETQEIKMIDFWASHWR